MKPGRPGWAAAVLAAVLGAAAAGCAGREIKTPAFLERVPALVRPGATDEEQVLAVLADVQDGMQRGRVYRVLAHVSEQYRDAEGRDYAGIRDHVARLLRTYRQITVTRAGTKVAVQADRARVDESFGTVAIPYDMDASETVSVQGQLSVYLAREGDVWRIVEWSAIR